MNQETEDTRTPKEKYDQEMKDINNTIAPERPELAAGLSEEQVEELDEELEAVEDAMEEHEEEIDKNMGDVKENATSTMTQDQFLDQEVEKQRQNVLKTFTGVGAKQERLSPEDQKKMTKVLELVNGGKINDPVLKYMVDSKLDLAADQANLMTETKKIQLEVVKKMSDVADKVMKNKGAMEHKNREILLYVQKNPKVLEPDAQLDQMEVEQGE